jgi:hypothetical protein
LLADRLAFWNAAVHDDDSDGEADDWGASADEAEAEGRSSSKDDAEVRVPVRLASVTTSF